MLNDTGLESSLESVFALCQADSAEPGTKASFPHDSPDPGFRGDLRKIIGLKQAHPISDDVMLQAFLPMPDIILS